MSMEVSSVYCSIGCARTPHAADWSSSGVLAFAADTSIALARALYLENPEELVVYGTLHGHKDRVNCVGWIRWRRHDAPVNNKDSEELVSGSVDSCVRVWGRTPEGELGPLQSLSGHTQPVVCLTSSYYGDSSSSIPTHTIIVSGSSDSTVIVWRRPGDHEAFSASQTLSFGRGFVLGMDLYMLPQSSVMVLACGGDDGKTHLYTTPLSTANNEFVEVLALFGHEDWVRDLHWTSEVTGDLLLASCSQDMYIRVWRVTTSATGTPEEDLELQLKGNRFSIQVENEETEYTVTLETVLLGHDNWVYSVRWYSAGDKHPLRLLSASMDKTMILWQPDTNSSVWVEQVRVGEVGGNTLGLYGGVFGPCGNMILAHGYQGAFHLWRRVKEGDKSGMELWKPIHAPSGHFGPVQDLSWEPINGRYLVSVSSDQTARLHAPWLRANGKVSWHELSRPQIHGYDMQCVATLSPAVYISGADEKVMRVFSAPRNFIDNFERISLVELEQGDCVVMGASVPSLGLSNKAVLVEEKREPKDLTSEKRLAEEVAPLNLVKLREPPVEDDLLQNTLWPETQKLYGHGYELYAVAASPQGNLIASACKASKPEHACIRVWDTRKWRQVACLTFHTLTVTQLAFSHSGRLLLAVSRDRSWSLWQQESDKDGGISFTLIGKLDKASKAHSRIIWACTWSHDDCCFATASRDKRVCVWSNLSDKNQWKLTLPPLDLPQPVTAVDFAPQMLPSSRYLLAAGLEVGQLLILQLSLSATEWHPLASIAASLCHTAAVRRLQWQPLLTKEERTLLLASCSVDHSVRIFRVNF